MGPVKDRVVVNYLSMHGSPGLGAVATGQGSWERLIRYEFEASRSELDSGLGVCAGYRIREIGFFTRLGSPGAPGTWASGIPEVTLPQTDQHQYARFWSIACHLLINGCLLAALLSCKLIAPESFSCPLHILVHKCAWSRIPSSFGKLLGSHKLTADVRVLRVSQTCEMDLVFDFFSWQKVAGTIIAYCGTLAIYRLFLHPLARFPGPKLAAVSRWYEGYYDVIQGGQYTRKIADLHKQYGATAFLQHAPTRIADPG